MAGPTKTTPTSLKPVEVTVSRAVAAPKPPVDTNTPDVVPADEWEGDAYPIEIEEDEFMPVSEAYSHKPRFIGNMVITCGVITGMVGMFLLFKAFRCYMTPFPLDEAE